MKITFDVKNQIITRTDRNQVISNSGDYLEAEISFSADWTGLEKTMTFKNGDELYTIVLANDKILQENHLNLGVGTWKASIIGIAGDQKIVTNECNVSVNSSGWIGSESIPPESVWNQLLVIIQSLHTEAASTAVVRSAVQKYIEDNYDSLVKEYIIIGNVREIIEELVQDGTISDLIAPFVTQELPGVVTTQLPGVVTSQLPAVVTSQLPSVVSSQLPAVAASAAAAEVGTWLTAHVDPDTGYVIDNTLTVSLAAADAKTVGDKVTAIKSALSDLKDTYFNDNVLYSEDSVDVSGSGTYVYKTLLTINNPTVGDTYALEFSDVSGALSVYPAYIYSYDENDVRTSHPIQSSNKKGSYTVQSGDAKLTFTLYPSDSGATSATYSNVKIYKGAFADQSIKSEKLSNGIDGNKITNATIAQEKLSFAEFVSGNLFDYTNADMCKKGSWYYNTTIGAEVTLGTSASTVNYAAIKCRVYNAQKITIGCAPSNDRKIYWVGAVDEEMRLLSYDICNSVGPVTFDIPDGTYYFLASYNLGTEQMDSYVKNVMVVNGTSFSGYSAYYEPYWKLNNCKTDGESENVVNLHVPSSYDLVVGDTFQLFYKGIINAVHPEQYYLRCECTKGQAFSRYFEITPNTAETLSLKLTLYNMKNEILDSKTISLVIHAKASNPASAVNVLCVGDSLTTGGTWVIELNRRLKGSGGTPSGDELTNINFIGTRVASGVHYEGYGGWTLNSYNTANVSFNARIITCTHDKTEADDQHSIYKDANNVQWKLETIENGQIKILCVSGEGRDFPNSGTLTWVSGGVHHSDITYTAQEMAPGNPFWDAEDNEVDFAKYASNIGASSIDIVYVLIGWNSAATSEDTYKGYAQTFIDNVKASFPNAKIVFVGLEIPARDGLGNNYGANGIYAYYYGLMQYVFNLDNWYKDVADDNTNVYSVNLSGQFDTEYNMPTGTRQVNTRNTETVTYQSNGVHPATSGYYQIADAVYRDITKRL